MNRILEEELECEIAETYWEIVHPLWKDFNYLYGYTPLMVVLKHPDFIDMWLEEVGVN